MENIYDKNGKPLHEGDRVHDDDGLDLIVRRFDDGSGWYGQLVCEPTHSCADIPYYLNQQKIELVETAPGISKREIKQKSHIELDNMKGFITRSVLASCTYKHHDTNTNEVTENNKALVAITVISARDYQPHAMISVIVNGKETAFGTDTKKAIEFYNTL